MTLEYFVDPEKRINYLYLTSSLLLAYYIYHTLKIKYSFFKYIFNKKVWLSKSAFVDYFMIFFNSLIKLLLIAPFIKYGLYLAYYTDEFLSSNYGLVEKGLSKNATLIWFTIVLIILKDLFTYLTHFLMHKIPFLWEFHKIHHSATTLNPITQYRIHPVELIINNAVGICIFGLTMGVFDYFSNNQIHEIVFLGANVLSLAFLFFGSNLRHSHVKLKYFNKLENLIISPRQHQIHHSDNEAHFDKNLGSKLAIWDWFFGTLIKSKSVDKIKFGLGKEDNKNYDSFIKNLYMPFINLFRKLV
jgi:sterol desaturase/sphingolipid hydroxylase (fatty acid hydroxylase superfamily)